MKDVKPYYMAGICPVLQLSNHIPCEFCGDPLAPKKFMMRHWEDDQLKEFTTYDCPRKSCQDAQSYFFDMGKAQAKGEW